MSKSVPGPWTGNRPKSTKGLHWKGPDQEPNSLPFYWGEKRESLKNAAKRRAGSKGTDGTAANPFSKKTVKKRKKKAVKKAQKEYGTNAAKRTASSTSGGSPSVSYKKNNGRRDEAQNPEREGGLKRRYPGKMTRSEYKKKLTSAAVRSRQNDKRHAENYKGKYFGPDEFKGNQAKINKWKLAGKPKNKSKFV